MEKKILLKLTALLLLIGGFVIFLFGKRLESSIMVLIGIAIYFIDKKLNPQLS